MNRTAFMEQLEGLLQNISPAERQEALQYYNDYFDDAGVENEEEVIENLGSPATIAENIINDLNGMDTSETMWQKRAANPRAVAKYDEVDASGFQGASHQQCQGAYTEGADTGSAQHADAGTQGTYAYGAQNAQAQNTYAEPKQELSGGVIALIVVLAILSFPIWGGLFIALIGVLIALVATWFSLIIAFASVTLAMFAVLLALIIVGIMSMALSPLVGVALIGGGFVCGAIGILFLMLTVAMTGIATPAIFKGISWIFRKLFGKKKSI